MYIITVGPTGYVIRRKKDNVIVAGPYNTRDEAQKVLNKSLTPVVNNWDNININASTLFPKI